MKSFGYSIFYNELGYSNLFELFFRIILIKGSLIAFSVSAKFSVTGLSNKYF